MKCPVCSLRVSRVLESRDVEEASSIRRRRECLDCKHRFTTYERPEVPNLMVVKKNGERELFNREKLSRGIYRAFEKRPIGAVKIEEIISEVERLARGMDQPELDTNKIGAIVMDELLQTDDVAYVRFASVYRSFTSLSSFEKELTKIKKLHN
ncbi:transcriptional repressor NrdR [Patescibacteria group bacterium]|nr:transcriptional repressor NrdR [Patescibacteria group bacterium]